MSGICGLHTFTRPLLKSDLEPMLSGLRVRDQRIQGSVGNKLALLGTVQGFDTQSVFERDGIFAAVDCDLINLADIKAKLAMRGVVADGTSVAEIVSHLYQQFQLDFVAHLVGAFAIAIWDESARRLVLAIDPLGIKSLYWSEENDGICFASRLSSVLSGRSQDAELNPSAVINFLLYSMVPAPMTPFKDVEKMRPGHLLICEGGKVRHQKFWDMQYEESRDRNVSAWATRVREAMRAAVLRTYKDLAPEKTGAFLSGGTDSSSVVAFMNERHSPVNTFSIFFEDERWSEIDYARTTAGHFKTRHFERALYAPDTVAVVDMLAEYYDEPFANSSAVGCYYCALMARENGIDTLLSGDGGDEIFGGNQRYADDKLFQLFYMVPGPLRSLISVGTKLLPPSGKLSMPRRYVRRAQIPNPRRVMSYNVFLENPAAQVFESQFLREAPPETWLSIAEGHFQRANARTELNKHLYMDVKMTLADNDLRKVQGTAELAGIKVRYPLLDPELAQFTGTIPTSLKLKGFEKRFIFKQAMTGILPEKVLYKKKHGFGVPVSKWLLENPTLRTQMHDLLSDRRTLERGYFQKQFIHKLRELHENDDVAFYGETMWYLLVLELWHRNHVDARKRVTSTT
ncbi:MAG TPA: asparagine synthase-related protein [Terriglobales bacterium]|nr:asparagine synthase-related protein [Terriglobales bacterium]